MARLASAAGCGAEGLIRRAAFITSIMFLTACGFQPLQSQAYKSSLAVDLSALEIEAKGTSSSSTAGGTTLGLDRRYGEMLKADINDQINPEGDRNEKMFKVMIVFNEVDVSLFVNPDGTASRGDLIFSSTYTITRLRDGKPVTSGTLTRTSSYSTSPTADYASYVSIEDARKRGVEELAQDYKLRLATLLPTFNNPLAVAPKKSETPLPILQPAHGYENRPPGY